MLLRMQEIDKAFNGIFILDKVNFELQSGEVHALIGQNGAGKSTLINIISGLYQQDNGKIFIEDHEIKILSTTHAHNLGISTVFQEPVLVQNMSVAENIFLGSPIRVFKVISNFRKMVKEAKRILQEMGLYIDPCIAAKYLTLNEQYLVCIARSLLMHPKILIMDESTAALSRKERETLFKLIQKIKSAGTGIIYITHTLDEIAKICDNVTIIRDGKNIVTCRAKSLTHNEMVYLMSGKRINLCFPPINKNIGEEILRVENLSKVPYFKDVSFTLRKGEILGFAGLAGQGRTTLAKVIFGQIKKDSGRIYWHNEEVNFSHPREAIANGFGLLNKDRIESGLFMDMNISENISISSLEKISRLRFIKLNVEQELSIEKVIELDIKANDIKQKIKYLSGGNQQKTMLGRWLFSQSDLLILDEPTRGIDVISKTDLYVTIRELVDEGKGIMLISSDITEMIGICSKIVIMRHGTIDGEMSNEGLSEESVLKAMIGP